LTSTIESMGVEIRNQIDDLPSYTDSLSKSPPPAQSESGGGNCIFTGAGDSYAAALAAEILSRCAARCLDPYEISRQPSLASNLHLYVISVSGRTKSNIAAAKAVSGYSREVSAITANRDSQLSKCSDSVIELRFRSKGQLTPGTVSFTTSLLACYSLISSLPKNTPIGDVYEEALSWCHGIEVPSRSTTFLVGTGLAYPLAMYGMAKIYEVLGFKSQCQRTEEFSHMELFSLTKDDLVLVMPENGSDRNAEKLHSLLEENSLKTALLPPRFRNEIEESVRRAIYLQVLAWRSAKKRGMMECSFINRGELLKISDKMIYI